MPQITDSRSAPELGQQLADTNLSVGEQIQGKPMWRET
jgi:hypothetical protein